MTTNSEILRVISSVEDELKADGREFLDYAPIIRQYIYFGFRKRQQKKFPALPIRFLKIIRALFSSFGSLVSLVVLKRRVDYILVAPARHRNFFQGNAPTSKHLDSLINLLSNHSLFKLEVGEGGIGVLPSIHNMSVLFRLLRFFVRLEKTTLNDVRGLSKRVESLVCESGEEFELKVGELNSMLLQYLEYRKIFQVIFSKVSIKSCVFVAYYNVESLALSSVLNEVGVDTIDYQHGVQGDAHPFYTNWPSRERMPKSVPKHYWVWDEISQIRLGKVIDGFGGSVNIVGNLWQAQQKRLRTPTSIENRVLVALQLWPDHFNTNVLQLINMKRDCIFVFREHPLALMDERAKIDLQEKYPNITFSDVSFPVEDDIDACCLCITGYSTVGIESLHLGVNTIFTHENSWKGFSQYIDGRHAVFAETESELIDAFDRMIS